MESRSIVKSIIFTIITCGLYGIYWFVKITNESHEALGRKTTASGGMAFLYSIITCSIYYFYWAYKMGQTITEAKEMRNMHTDGNASVIYLLFSFFGLAIVAEALMQSALNEIAEFDAVQAQKLPVSSADNEQR